MAKLKIGARLRQLREEKGLSQVDAAKEIGVSRKSMSCYEKDVTTPPIEILKTISQYYDTTVDYIITGNRIEYKEIKVKDKKLLNYFEKIDSLDPKLKKSIEVVLNGFILGYSSNKNVDS